TTFARICCGRKLGAPGPICLSRITAHWLVQGCVLPPPSISQAAVCQAIPGDPNGPFGPARTIPAAVDILQARERVCSHFRALPKAPEPTIIATSWGAERNFETGGCHVDVLFCPRFGIEPSSLLPTTSRRIVGAGPSSF